MSDFVRGLRNGLSPGEKFIWDSGPYEPWMMHSDPTKNFPWGIKGAGGWNCFGYRGAVFLSSKEAAEAVVDLHLKMISTMEGKKGN